MNDQPDFFSDDELRQALTSSSLTTEPSPQRADQLRLLLASQLSQSNERVQSASARHRGRSSSSGRAMGTLPKLATIAAMLLLAFLVSRTFVGTASANLRSVLDATRKSLWIHAQTTVNHLGETSKLESWCSPQQRIAAFRSVQMLHFVNYQEGIQTSYSDFSGSVMRWRADVNNEEMGRTFVNALLNDGDLQAVFPLHEVSPVLKTRATVHDQRRIRYSFQVALKAVPSVHWETFVDVDPSSGLIASWEEVHAGGTHIITQFDYPDSGPGDIYELGANRGATIVDRVASSDVVELATDFQRQVQLFGDYQALVIDQPLNSDGGLEGETLLRQVERNGEQLRVHLVVATNSTVTVPSDANLAWWRAHRHQFSLEPLAECDGRVCKLHPFDEQWGAIDSELQPRVQQTTDFPVLRVKNEFGTSVIPIWPSLWPEYACRPMLITTDPSLRFDIDPSGAGGPANSIRLRLLSPDSPFSKERAQYWFSIDQDHSLAKSIDVRPNFESFSFGPAEKRVVNQYFNYLRSPSGIAYATERITSEGDDSKRLKRKFIVDFGARE